MAVEVRGRGGGSPQARGSGLVADREFTDASGSGIGVPLAQNREGVCPSGPICGGGRALGGDEAEPAELRWKEGDVAGDLPGGGVGAGFAKETLQGAPSGGIVGGSEGRGRSGGQGAQEMVRTGSGAEGK